MTDLQLVPFGTSAPHGPIEFTGPEHYNDDEVAALRADADGIVAKYPQARSALLPLLHLVQSHDGYVTRAGVEFCADVLSLTAAQVSSVATFYSMYRREPTGEHLVGVCTTTLCAVMGGDAILATLSERLGIAPGETTDDGRITLEHVECNAACDFAPVVMVNWEFFDDQTPDTATALVDDLRAGSEVVPSRGAESLCSFREVERLLAGAPSAGQGPSTGPSTRSSASASDRLRERGENSERGDSSQQGGRQREERGADPSTGLRERGENSERGDSRERSGADLATGLRERQGDA